MLIDIAGVPTVFPLEDGMRHRPAVVARMYRILVTKKAYDIKKTITNLIDKNLKIKNSRINTSNNLVKTSKDVI